MATETTVENGDEGLMRIEVDPRIFGKSVRHGQRSPVARVVAEPEFGESRLVSRRQLRAARALAGLTQAALSLAVGMNREICKYWEKPMYPGDDGWPTTNPRTLAKIVAVLEQHGVEVFCHPAPGVRMTSQRAVAR